MRRILLTLLALTCMATAQSASPQQQASKAPAASAASTTSAAPELGSASGTQTANVDVDPAVPMSMALQATSPNKKHANAKAAQMDPEDPNKSPYWDPKDWSYIYNQGP